MAPCPFFLALWALVFCPCAFASLVLGEFRHRALVETTSQFVRMLLEKSFEAAFVSSKSTVVLGSNHKECHLKTLHDACGTDNMLQPILCPFPFSVYLKVEWCESPDGMLSVQALRPYVFLRAGLIAAPLIVLVALWRCLVGTDRGRTWNTQRVQGIALEVVCVETTRMLAVDPCSWYEFLRVSGYRISASEKVPIQSQVDMSLPQVLCSAYTAHLLVWALQAQPSLLTASDFKGWCFGPCWLRDHCLKAIGFP